MNKNYITPFGKWTPHIAENAYVDIAARVIGNVVVGAEASIWPMAVLRADSESIEIGRRAAILDLSLVEAPESFPATIEEEAIISHNAVIHGAVIKTGALVGIGAVVLDGAVVNSGCIIGAGSVVTPGTIVEPDSLVLGTPGRVIRPTTSRERDNIRRQVKELYDKSRQYMKS